MNPPTLLSGRTLARRTGSTPTRLVRAVLAGRIRPDFIADGNRLLFHPEREPEIREALSEPIAR